MNKNPIKTYETRTLALAYEEQGPVIGQSVVLLHGFPDDVRAWDGVVDELVKAGYRTLCPYLRGFGPTRFLRDSTPRVGHLAALTQGIMDWADGLKLTNFILIGQDWGPGLPSRLPRSGRSA